MSLFLEAPSLRVLGVPHGFSLRGGGVSGPPFESLNLGAVVGDAPEAVNENLRRLAAAAGVAAFHQVSQVHGAEVVEVGEGVEVAELVRREADALFTRTAGVAVAVRTADCTPILLAADDGTAVAAVHAGWRGTIAGAAGRAVAALLSATGLESRSLLAVIGPCIRACCYEVDPELGERFAASLGEASRRPGPRGRPHLDLVASNRAVLTRAGVLPERIEVLNGCTACEPDRFFSHRRDSGRTGRHLAFISPVPAGRGRPL